MPGWKSARQAIALQSCDRGNETQATPSRKNRQTLPSAYGKDCLIRRLARTPSINVGAEVAWNEHTSFAATGSVQR